MSVYGPVWFLLDQAEQERLIASGVYDAERCCFCGAFIEVWQREDADAVNDWQGVPPAFLALFTRNPADWRVIASLRGSTCSAGGDHTQRNGEPRAYATMIRMSDATFGRRFAGGQNPPGTWPAHLERPTGRTLSTIRLPLHGLNPSKCEEKDE